MLWRIFAFIVSRSWVRDYLIRRSKRTPYFNLPGYMNRDWLFNGYPEGRPELRRFKKLPSFRIHHILRRDLGEHKHDHPWNFRTFILDGWYREARRETVVEYPDDRGIDVEYLRKRGDTATLDFGQYHEITEVPSGGCWTLVMLGERLGQWGFLVDGVKVLYTEYDESKRLPNWDERAAAEYEQYARDNEPHPDEATRNGWPL